MATIRDVNPHEEPDLTSLAIAELSVVRGGIEVKPHVQRFFDDLEEYLGFGLSLGTYPEHSPPEGPTQAVDFFNTVDAAGYTIQDRACTFFRDNCKLYGGRYCIRRSQIWNVERADEGWRWQTVYGDATRDHRDHSHYTFYADAPINYEDKGDKNMGNTWFRYAFGGQDYVIDRVRGTRSLTTHPDQLNALDKLGVVELGKVSKYVDDYFKGLYS